MLLRLRSVSALALFPFFFSDLLLEILRCRVYLQSQVRGAACLDHRNAPKDT